MLHDFETFPHISIHSLRMEGDLVVTIGIGVVKISIHSLRMEGDNIGKLFEYITTHFNPLPPHGGRQNNYFHVFSSNCISIHSLRMEGDIS